MEIEVNRKWSEDKVSGLKTNRAWRDTPAHRTHPLHALGGHVLAHHLGHLGMRHHGQRARENDCSQNQDCSGHKDTHFWFARSSHRAVSFKAGGF